MAWIHSWGSTTLTRAATSPVPSWTDGLLWRCRNCGRSMSTRRPPPTRTLGAPLRPRRRPACPIYDQKHDLPPISGRRQERYCPWRMNGRPVGHASKCPARSTGCAPDRAPWRGQGRHACHHGADADQVHGRRHRCQSTSQSVGLRVLGWPTSRPCHKQPVDRCMVCCALRARHHQIQRWRAGIDWI